MIVFLPVGTRVHAVRPLYLSRQYLQDRLHLRLLQEIFPQSGKRCPGVPRRKRKVWVLPGRPGLVTGNFHCRFVLLFRVLRDSGPKGLERTAVGLRVVPGVTVDREGGVLGLESASERVPTGGGPDVVSEPVESREGLSLGGGGPTKRTPLERTVGRRRVEDKGCGRGGGGRA